MRRQVLLFLAVSLLGSACGDDTEPALPDARPPIDAAIEGPDAPPATPDAAEPPDAAAAPIGAACSLDGECTSALCADGWPGGYCTALDCDLDQPDTSCLPFGGDGVCLDVGSAGSPRGMCYDLCPLDAPDCRAEYDCLDIGLGGGQGVCDPAPVCGNGYVERGEECEPPGTAECDASCQGTGTEPVGAPCTSPAQCAGDYCIDDWPQGGYCTQTECDLGAWDTSCAPYGGDGVCLDVGDPGAPFGLCFDACALGGADCRSEYDCLDVGLGGGQGVCYPKPVCGNGVVEAGEECEPPGTAECDASCQGTGTDPVGAACTGSASCAGNTCIGWPDGYCSDDRCDPLDMVASCAPYGGDGVCLDVGGFGLCFDRCQLSAPDCRAGYQCEDVGFVGDQGVCLPTAECGNGRIDAGEECEPPGTGGCDAQCQSGTAPVGAACADSAECAGDTCLEAASGWPDGYCSQDGCDLAAWDTSCAAYGGDGVCVNVGGGRGMCFDECDTAAPDCRAGYFCLDVGLGGTRGVCYPTPVCGNDIVEIDEECEPPGVGNCDASCQGTGAAPVGAPCAGVEDCAGDYCVSPADGFPDGYCILTGCDPTRPTTSCAAGGGDGYCLGGGGTGECYDLCALGGADCRAGYVCLDVGLGGGDGVCYPTPVCGNGLLEYTEECEPPGAGICGDDCQGTGTAPVGDPCADELACAGNFCLSEADYGYPDGYCSHQDCDLGQPDTSCDAVGGGICLDVGGFGMCFDLCALGGADCRAGYDCLDIGLGGGQGICDPTPVCGNGSIERGEECDPPDGSTCDANCQSGTAEVGAPCASGADCLGNYCLGSAEGFPASGYCTQLDCDLGAPTTSCLAYGADAVCVDLGTPVCLDTCARNQDCATGLRCQTIGTGRFCLP